MMPRTCDVAGIGVEHLLQVVERRLVAPQPDVREADLLVDGGGEVGAQGQQLLVLGDRLLVALGLVGVLGLGERLQHLGRRALRRRLLELDLDGRRPRALAGRETFTLLRRISVRGDVDVPLAGHEAEVRPLALLVGLDAAGPPPRAGKSSLTAAFAIGLPLCVGDPALEASHALPVLGGGARRGREQEAGQQERERSDAGHAGLLPHDRRRLDSIGEARGRLGDHRRRGAPEHLGRRP